MGEQVLRIVPFWRFSETLIQPYVRTYERTGYGLFLKTAAHDWRIFAIAKIGSPDKEIVKIAQ